jgi:hypothetical protein
MRDKRQKFMTQLVTAVYHGKGVTDRSLRAAIKGAVVPGADKLDSNDSPVAVALRPYLNKVSHYAYKVTDRDIEALKTQGYSEEAIFELTISAAVGAGLSRLNQGLAALNGGQASLNGGG